MDEAERDRTAEMNNLRAENERREKALAAQGVAIDGNGMQMLLVAALRDMVIGDDPERQFAYELSFQRAVAKAFDEIESQVARAKLTAPMPNNGRGLHIAR